MIRCMRRPTVPPPPAAMTDHAQAAIEALDVQPGQTYRVAPFLCRDGRRVNLGTPPSFTRIVIVAVPGGRRKRIAYRKLDPKPGGNGRSDRGLNYMTPQGLARNFDLET
jgi:hypothetical protein